MKLGIGYEAILRWYHPSALMHYKGTHNLALVCKECHDPDFIVAHNVVREEKNVHVGSPVHSEDPPCYFHVGLRDSRRPCRGTALPPVERLSSTTGCCQSNANRILPGTEVRRGTLAAS
mmetsp:Transcript_6542/g.9406  ORF Transcript_6542/g.9406 Transcript_6542/m.9406 type:complete len:119 (-) Transcript_6542:150-506(-)